VRVGATPDEELLDPRRRVAESAAAALDQVPVLLFRPRLIERRPLDRSQFQANADCIERVDDGFAYVSGSGIAEVLASIEAMGMTGVTQELPGLDRVIGIAAWRLPVKLEARRTGMRRSEVLGMTWERVDRARGVVMLDVTKSGKRREVPLNSRADAVLARRGSKSSGLVFATKRWDHFRTAWENAVARAKLADFHFHDLRHTFASWAVQRGATLQEVKDLLGHSSLAMVMRYAHLSPEHLRTAVARLDAALPIKVSAQGSAQEVVTEGALLSK